MKTCSKCSISKGHDLFAKDPRNKDGYQSQCQSCRKQAASARASSRRGLVTVSEKCCNKCGSTKPSVDFYKDSALSDGLANICKVCKNERTDEWREKNRSKYNANMRKMRSEQKERFKDIDLKRTYGIRLEQYNEMLRSQGGVCLICKKPAKGKRPLVVDHNHETGAVRGLLCYGCNRALHTLENPELLVKAQDYLKKFDET